MPFVAILANESNESRFCTLDPRAELPFTPHFGHYGHAASIKIT